MEHQARVSLTRLLPRLETRFAASTDTALWPSFKARLERHWEAFFGPLLQLYGNQYDFFYHLESMLEMAVRMYTDRPAELKALDRERENNPSWFESQAMIGGVCYVDRF